MTQNQKVHIIEPSIPTPIKIPYIIYPVGSSFIPLISNHPKDSERKKVH